MKCLCDVLSAFGHGISENEHVQVILAGLSMEYESVITLAAMYSPIPMMMDQLVEALLECENR